MFVKFVKSNALLLNTGPIKMSTFPMRKLHIVLGNWPITIKQIFLKVFFQILFILRCLSVCLFTASSSFRNHLARSHPN
jgi:hypothetical protein